MLKAIGRVVVRIKVVYLLRIVLAEGDVITTTLQRLAYAGDSGNCRVTLQRIESTDKN